MRYLIVLLLTGCASARYIDMSRPPASDWPELKVSVKQVPIEDVYRRCDRAPNAYAPRGCAQIYFAKRECVILDAGVDLEHERMHCLGYDHPGETAVHDAWDRYKARGEK